MLLILDAKTVVESLIEHLTSTDEPATKKRKIDATAATNDIGTARFTVDDLSFSSPVRKKLSITVTSTHFVIHPPNALSEAIASTHSSTLGLLCVVPDATKAAKVWTFCFVSEGIVFTIPDAATKLSVQGTVPSVGGKAYEQLTALLVHTTGVQVQKPDARLFTSNLKPMSGTKDDIYNVPAHKGSRDGQLYFLPGGVLFGFKKPLQFFDIKDIKNVAFHSIVSRTFNISIETEEESTEFSMIDQVDFEGIKGWIEKVGINDDSLNEKRQAKKVKEAVKAEDGDENDQVPPMINDDGDDDDDEDFADDDEDEPPEEMDSQYESSDEE